MNNILSFEDEAQAYAEIEAMGYHPMALDFPAEENALHWHDFDSVLYSPQASSQCLLRVGKPRSPAAVAQKLSAQRGLFTVRKHPDTAPLSGSPSRPRH